MASVYLFSLLVHLHHTKAVSVGLLALAGLLVTLSQSVHAEGAPRSVDRMDSGVRYREVNTPSHSAHRPWTWEVKGGRGRMWLVGCIHLGLREDVPVYGSYRLLCEQVNEIYFETKPGAWESYETRMLMARKGYQAYGHSLATTITPQTWRQLERAVASDPSQLVGMSRMQPWMAAFTFLHGQYQTMGLSREYGLEGVVQRDAIRDGKLVGGLETPLEQIKALADASIKEQEEFLKSAIRDPDANNAQTRALRRAWLQGDEAELKSILGLSGNRVPTAMDQRLVSQRNLRWMRAFRDIEQRGNDCVVFVGVEHLITPHNSLISVLERRGLYSDRIIMPGTEKAQFHEGKRKQTVLNPFYPDVTEHSE